MSLSSFLFGSKKMKAAEVVDGDLDALFRSSAIEIPLASSSKAVEKVEKKRKRHMDAEPSTADVKKSKSSKVGKASVSDAPDPAQVTTTPTPKKGKHEKGKKGKEVVRREEPAESDDEADDAGLEDAYHTKKVAVPAKVAQAQEGSSDSESDSEGDVSKLVHESISKQTHKKTRTKPVKFTPEAETSEQRDARTIFVGNVPIDVAKNKASLKQFKRHILTLVPTAKIESTRFRSVAFQNPTSKLTGDQKSEPKANDGRTHDRERAATWRAANPPTNDEEREREEERKRLSTQEKKRIAFIKHEIHGEADALHAYVVFAHPVPRAANIPAVQVLDPYEAARLAVEKCDGTVFIERTLRVDTVGKPGRAAGKEGGGIAGDPKRTVFVGNLDFASKEEDLRVFFEGVVSAERGPRGDNDSESEGEEEEDEGEAGEPKPKTWVTRVRIIRDKDTQLGKGFAYVQFSDRQCVDEVLGLDETKLKFAKRKLRVQRCKTLPGGAKVSKLAAGSGKSSSSQTKAPKTPRVLAGPKPAPIPIPKGNPLLGEKLAHLPKEKRKEAKAADAERVARRLAKKKARNALEKAGVKGQKKDRERVRKTAGDRKGGAPKEQKKGRIRSEKSGLKRNAKK